MWYCHKPIYYYSYFQVDKDDIIIAIHFGRTVVAH